MHTAIPAQGSRLLPGVCLTLVLWGDGAWAETVTGSILGKVTDHTGGVLPGTAVVIENQATAARRSLLSDPEGRYAAAGLPPGVYRIEATLAGFRRAVRGGVTLRVSQDLVVDLALEVGALQDSVVVTADAAMLANSAALGTVVDNHKILELPLNGRDFFQLATIAAGAVPAAEGSQNVTQGGAVSVNGAREQSNNFLLDGIDNSDLAINQVVVPISVEAVQEFKIESGSYSAEFGRSAGGQFNYVTRSGSNTWHGSAYEFVRDEALDARNFFADPEHDKPSYSRNQFGASLGGPIERDRLFAFGHYESTRIRQAFTRIATVPPLAWRRGDFSGLSEPVTDPLTGEAFPGNVIPDSRLDPAGAAILGFYPDPDDPSATGPSSASVAPRGSTDIDQFTIRLDYVAGPGSQVFARYSLWNEDRFNPFDPLVDPTNVPGFGSFTENNGQALGLGWTWTIGDRAVNELRLGFNRLRAGIFHEHRGQDVSSALGIRGLLTNPNDVGRPGVIVGITDALIEPTNLPQERRDKTFQLSESLAWRRGRHSFKAGFDVRHFSVQFYLDFIARGQFIFTGLSGNPIADLLLGMPTLALRQNPETTTDSLLRATLFDAYVQDDFRLSDRLSLHLGLRYEYNQPPYEAKDRFSVPLLDDPIGRFLPVGQGGIPRAGYAADTNNLAPRLGFVWRPTASGSTALRGAYGLYYDVGILNTNILLRFNPPHFALDLASGALSLRDAFTGGTDTITFVEGIDAGYRDGHYHHWSLGVQHQMGSDLLAELGYVGSAGRDLALRLDLNQGPAGGPPLRNPSFGPAEVGASRASSDYHAFQARLERRLADGLSLLTSYTWSRSRDTASALFGARASSGMPQNSFDPEADRGPSDFDTPHRFVLSATWELPFGRGKRHLNQGGLAAALLGGWQLACIATLQSGRPFTVYYGAAANYSGTDNGANGGLGFDRPDQTGNPVPVRPDPALWFDPTAFTPPPNRFGTVGRNTLRGDGLQVVDLGLYRKLAFGARGWVQLRVEAFNLFNHPNFFLPVGDLTSASAGRVVRAYDSRQIQLAVKVGF